MLAHYDDDFEMASPRIVDVAGEPSGVLRGKASVGAYWTKALGLIPDLRFELLGVFVGAQSVALPLREPEGRPGSSRRSTSAPGGLVLRAAAHYA